MRSLKNQSGFTMYIIAALLAVMGAMALGGWLYHKDTQATIAMLTADNVALEIQVEEDKLIIAQNKADQEQQVVINGVINKRFAQTRMQVGELQEKLRKKNAQTGKTRDIGKLAIYRPRVLAKIFTKGTTQALRCVELASGAEHTADELAAERKSQINGHCTELANPNYLPH
jgi:hypothetical protein